MFHKRKGLGAIAEGSAEEWVLSAPLDGDTLATLATAYGVAAKDIAARNGTSWNVKAIQEWVKASGGRVLPYDAGSHPFEDSNEGWAVFTGNSQILLPAKLRNGVSRAIADLKKPPPALMVRGNAGGKVVLVLAALGLGMWALVHLKKKGKI